MAKQGYVTLALSQQKYVAMAVNLALSIRLSDPARPICLIHDDAVDITDDVRDTFDTLVLLPTDPLYVGVANKIRIYDVSPFQGTMFIDADCLLVRDDIDRHWKAASSSYFGMMGEKASTGTWARLDISETCRQFNIPYVAQIHSGVFYFHKCDEASRFFEKVNWLYRNHRHQVSMIHQGRKEQYADEPLFGVAMGMFGLSPVHWRPEEGSWIVTTWRARRCRIDPTTGIWSMEKPVGHWFGIPLPILAKGWVHHTPTIYHFIALEPRTDYERAVNHFVTAFRSGKSRRGQLPLA
jgi:hypothetical protein